MTALGQYSDTHIAAYKKWQRVGSTEITEADLDAIEREDSATGAHIRQERMKAAQKRADELRAQAQTLTPKAAKGVSVVPVTERDFEALSDALIKAFKDGDESDWETLVKQHGSKGVPFIYFHCFAMTQLFALRKFVRDTNEKNQRRNERLDRLESGTSNERGVDVEYRLRALEERLIHRGLWEAGISYPQGAPVTWDGSMWIAAEPTRGIQPGDKSQPKVWILAVQRGREGRCKCPR